MSWSRAGLFAGACAVLFAIVGPMATIADLRVATPAGLLVGALVAVGLVIGSDAVLGVAVVAAGVLYAVGGIRGASGAAWAAIAGLIVVAGTRVCFEARRPARIAIGAQRAFVAAQFVAVGGVIGAVVMVAVLDDFQLGRGWIVAGVAVCTLPLFAIRVINSRPQGLRRPSIRYSLTAVALIVLATGIVAGAMAADRQRSAGHEPVADDVQVDDTPRNVEVNAPDAPTAEPGEPAPAGEWFAAIVSTLAVLIALGLLASNWFREQPLEFKPAEATPGEGGGIITDTTVEDPLAVLVSTEDATAVLDRALLAIEDVPDPRQAIRLAYSMVENGFGDLEARRQPSESEVEYLHRLLPALGASATAMQELTALFEQARFSGHEITESMRHSALSALVVVRSDLAPTQAAGVDS